MEKNYPNKPFERYADDIVMHCKTEKQAHFICEAVSKRLEACKLSVHPTKTKVVKLKGKAKQKYQRKYDFLGFTFAITKVMSKAGLKFMVAPRISDKSMKSVTEKITQT